MRVDVSVRVAPFHQYAQRAWERFVPQAQAILSQFADERFRTSTDPQGRRWKPLQSSTFRRALSRAKATVGGRMANPQVSQSQGRTIVRALSPRAGFQRTATVRRDGSSKPLVDTGRLRMSVVALTARSGALRVRRGYTLLWGTNLNYAKYHQYGTRRIPARPFLGAPPRLQTQLQQAYQQALGRVIQSGP